jgi:hypothetical protein
MAKRSTKGPGSADKASTPKQATSYPVEQPSERIDLDERRERIARAAYFRAERRNFQGDAELDDWLEAEREIDSAAAAGGIQSEASHLAEGPSDVSAPAIAANETEDPEHIAPSDVPRLAAALGVSASALRVAIERAGARVSDVKRYLEQHAHG